MPPAALRVGSTADGRRVYTGQLDPPAESLTLIVGRSGHLWANTLDARVIVDVCRQLIAAFGELTGDQLAELTAMTVRDIDDG